MLILTRKTDQGIVLAGNVKVRILAVDGERVKIGIDAPRSVQVLREELLDHPERIQPNGNGHHAQNGHANGQANGNGNGHNNGHDRPASDGPTSETSEDPSA